MILPELPAEFKQEIRDLLDREDFLKGIPPFNQCTTELKVLRPHEKNLALLKVIFKVRPYSSDGYRIECVYYPTGWTLVPMFGYIKVTPPASHSRKENDHWGIIKRIYKIIHKQIQEVLALHQ